MQGERRHVRNRKRKKRSIDMIRKHGAKTGEELKAEGK